MLILLTECGWYKQHFTSRKHTAASSTNSSTTTKEDVSAEQTPLTFSVNIEYADKRDYLRSLSVVEYPHAQLLMIRRASSGDDHSLVRFSGGVVIWQIEAPTVSRTLFSRKSPLSVLPEIPGGETKINRNLRVASVSYGKVPRGFVQVIPGSGPPDPLEPGEYYIVKVEREFGVTNYEVVRIDTAGDITAFDAEPRAGDSYELCCNVPAAFFAPIEQKEKAEKLNRSEEELLSQPSP